MRKDNLLNRLINGIYHLYCFWVLLLLVAATEIHFEEQALVVGTIQRRQASKAKQAG
jgi:hypothetical protein